MPIKEDGLVRILKKYTEFENDDKIYEFLGAISQAIMAFTDGFTIDVDEEEWIYYIFVNKVNDLYHLIFLKINMDIFYIFLTLVMIFEIKF